MFLGYPRVADQTRDDDQTFAGSGSVAEPVDVVVVAVLVVVAVPGGVRKLLVVFLFFVFLELSTKLQK